MKAGDVCVQRGTIHGWTNYTDKPARVYFILSGKIYPNWPSFNLMVINDLCSGPSSESWRSCIDEDGIHERGR